MEVPRIGPQSPQPLPDPSGREPEELSFKELIGRYVREVNDLQHEADQSVLELATGRTDNLHQVVAALSEADLSFRLMMEIRNKLLEAYQQIMRMQV